MAVGPLALLPFVFIACIILTARARRGNRESEADRGGFVNATFLAAAAAAPRRRPTLLPSVTDDPPPVAGARRVSLTFRPGEGLLLTGLDGRVEEIEPNFDLNV